MGNPIRQVTLVLCGRVAAALRPTPVFVGALLPGNHFLLAQRKEHQRSSCAWNSPKLPRVFGGSGRKPCKYAVEPPLPPQNEVEGEFILKDYSNINSGTHQPKTNTFLTGCSRTLLAFLAGKLLLLGCLDPCTGGCRDCVFAVKVSELLGAKVRGSFRCRGWLSGKTAFGTK